MAKRPRRRPFPVERTSSFRFSRRVFAEMWLNIRRNGVFSLACIAVAAISLLIFGIFLLLDGSLNNLVHSFEERVGISAYLKTTVTASDVAYLQGKIVAWPEVESVTYVSQEEAMDALKRDLAGYEEVLSSLVANPLPASLEIKPKNPQMADAIVSQLRIIPEVDDIQYDAQIVSKLIAFANYFRILGLIISLLFVLSTWFLLSSAIRMTAYARRPEIEIMKLVGATNGYIRYPFIAEGIFYGLIGAAMACVFVIPIRSILMASLQRLSFLSQVSPDNSYVVWVIIVLMALGSFLGAVAANLSVRRFLQE